MTNNGGKYNKEFKTDTVKLVVEKGRSVPSLSKDLGVSEKTIYAWVAAYRKDLNNAFPGSGKLKPIDEEMRQMKRRMADLEEENAILKKAAAIFINPRK